MILSFADEGTEDIYDGRNTKAARRKLPRDVWSVAQRKLSLLNAAAALDDLKAPPGNRLEALAGDLAGKHSIRINDQFRIVFRWREGAEEVWVGDYH